MFQPLAVALGRCRFGARLGERGLQARDLAPCLLDRLGIELAETVEQRAMAGQAIPSFAPMQASQYFHKIECFCFKQQTLQPGETRVMPVLFVVDPKLPKDVNTIAVSYTFFEVPGKGGKG